MLVKRVGPRAGFGKLSDGIVWSWSVRAVLRLQCVLGNN